MHLTLFILGVIGMTHIIVDSVIMEPVHAWIKPRSKFLAELMDCYQCSGFWCGVLLAPVLLSYNPLVWFAAGCTGSFLAQLGWLVLDTLEAVVKGKK
jgi:hypothetical protein